MVIRSYPDSEGNTVSENFRSIGDLSVMRQRWRAYPRRTTALASMYIATYFLAVLSLILLFAVKPPLSSVEISGQTPVKGKLLAHVDGFWYVFEQRENKQEATLVAVPDSKVEDVRVSE